MIVLGLDTTGVACACALVDEGRILASRSENIGRGHAERLAPMVRELMATAGVGIADIERIAVCTGPGSFTGLRVALAFAKGLSLPRKIPLIGISALEVHAARLEPDFNSDTSFNSTRDKPRFVYTDVRRGELCFQGFSEGGAVTTVMTKQADAAMAFMQGHGMQGHGMQGRGGAITEFSGSISVPIMAWLSMELSPESHPALPLYSRAPDAKLPKARL